MIAISAQIAGTIQVSGSTPVVAMHAQNDGPSEARRFEQLRAQDGKPLVPPPNVLPLCAGGGLDPAKHDAARKMWEVALAELSAAPSYPTEERLFWSAFLLARHYAEKNQREHVAPLLGPTLQRLSDARHQQTLLGLLARNNAVLGDHAAAAQQAAQLHARSEDLQIDTNYRFTTAFVALARGDAQGALTVLGSEIDDVPIADAYDKVCGVYRAHAHERLGRLDIAERQLRQLAPTSSELAGLGEIVRATPALGLCYHSFPKVEREVREMNANAVVTDSGINVRSMVLVPVLGSFVVVGSVGLFDSILDPPLREIATGVVIGGFTLLTMVLVLRSVMRGARQRKQLANTGVPGSAKLLTVRETGTRVNNQPMLELRMLVHLPDRTPYTAVHKEIVPNIRLASMAPGVDLPVRVDRDDPRIMAIAWQ